MKIIILFLIFTSILLYSCKPKPNYAQVKSAFYNCIETKLLQKQYSNESEADMHEFSNIIDVCKVEVQK